MAKHDYILRNKNYSNKQNTTFRTKVVSIQIRPSMLRHLIGTKSWPISSSCKPAPFCKLISLSLFPFDAYQKMVWTHALQFRSELSFYSEIIPSIIIISFKRLPKKRFMPFLVSSVNGSSIQNLYPGVGSPYKYVSILFPLSSLQLLHPSYFSPCSRTHLFRRFRISSCVFLKRRKLPQGSTNGFHLQDPPGTATSHLLPCAVIPICGL